jgi:uncharacterized protein
MSKNNVDVIRSFYDTVARGDPNTLPIDPQVEWIEPEVSGLWFGGTHHGPEAVINDVMKPALEKFDDFRVESDEFLDAGDRVVVTGHFRGREKETGIELNSPFIQIWTLRGGKVLRFQGASDTANWLQAMYHLQIEQPAGMHG